MADVDLEPEAEPTGRQLMNRARGLRWGTLRWGWATLTSMRTALLLLLLLGLAAIPGSLLPQRPTNPFGVAQYLADNPDTGAWLDRLGLFDVFGSAWFAAVYLLLFVSLIGCIIPRCRVYFDALRAEPGVLPRRLSRFPDHAAGSVTVGRAEVLDAGTAHLRRAGYRVRREADGLSAEKGYLREAGNLVFHLSLIAVLAGLAWGSVFSYRGTAIVVEGQAFSNTLTQYDEFTAGQRDRDPDDRALEHAERRGAAQEAPERRPRPQAGALGALGPLRWEPPEHPGRESVSVLHRVERHDQPDEDAEQELCRQHRPGHHLRGSADGSS